MELWIRSQDRTTLIRSYEIYIAEHSNSYVIRAKRTSHILGAYKTIERALEVLDEIQRILKPVVLVSGEINTNDNTWLENGIIMQKYKDTTPDIKMLDTYVYEMPKD